jgi:hypothetical protein
VSGAVRLAVKVAEVVAEERAEESGVEEACSGADVAERAVGEEAGKCGEASVFGAQLLLEGGMGDTHEVEEEEEREAGVGAAAVLQGAEECVRESRGPTGEQRVQLGAHLVQDGRQELAQFGVVRWLASVHVLPQQIHVVVHVGPVQQGGR